MGHDMNALHICQDTQGTVLLETYWRQLVAITLVGMIWSLNCIIQYVSQTLPAYHSFGIYDLYQVSEFSKPRLHLYDLCNTDFEPQSRPIFPASTFW